ncbi:LOW QUALITY PROTEIN: hypothetical protein OSB04_029334 [Centaurea solstitialis]|uniref:Reverse transcriptase Ty1/copia-type domain-containing protein n=1 Tax=Centaurea solstitialis TaxID=347529 RepID=A0AA38T272_9ASTR|nr:LOW QUALITY PROTEIN: hypothetical protein OSB04_029334 [Centaurea solstitialis]
MQSMYDNLVWELTDLPQRCKAIVGTNIVGSTFLTAIGNKWVFKKKTYMDENVHTFKARLVAKGFTQTHGIDYDETFSPVAMLKSIRILMAISAYFNYEIWQMDVKTAFLNGKLTIDVYMLQPDGFVDPKNPNKVCKLLKYIYGLKQASRSWNLHFDERIKEFGFSKIIGNDVPTLQGVKAWLGKCFQMKDLGEAAYILGIKIYKNRSRWLIGLSQTTYVDKIQKRFRMDESNKGFISMQHGIVLSKAEYPTSLEDLRMRLVSRVTLTLVSRPTYMILDHRYVFTLNGGAISWKSSKHDIIADSTTEAEYIAASDAAKEAVWLRNFISDLRVVANISRPVNIYRDNSGAVAQAKEPREYHKSRHVLMKGDVRICKIPTDENVADPLTKPLARVKHDVHASSIGMQYLDTSS